MSDSEQAAQAPATTATANNNAEEAAAPRPAAPEPTRPPAGGRGIAVIALVLAVLALAGIAYTDFNSRPLYGLTAQVEGDAERVAELRLALERRLERLEAEAAATATTAAELQSVLSREAGVTVELAAQLSELNSRLDEMTGIDSGRRTRLLRAEATYYLRIANAQAMLAGNPGLAASALRMADDRLREMADPALAPVRRQLGEDLAALEALPDVDIAGASFRLQALAAQVRGWPLGNTVPAEFRAAGAAGSSESMVAWERVKQTVADVFGSIVSVRQSDAPPEVQLTEAEQSLVIESVRAELQLARITLVTGELALYQQSVKRAAEQISRYFNTDATAVAAALEALADLEAAELPREPPDISGSLSLLLKQAEKSAADAP